MTHFRPLFIYILQLVENLKELQLIICGICINCFNKFATNTNQLSNDFVEKSNPRHWPWATRSRWGRPFVTSGPLQPSLTNGLALSSEQMKNELLAMHNTIINLSIYKLNLSLSLFVKKYQSLFHCSKQLSIATYS